MAAAPAPSSLPQALAAQRALPPAGGPRHAALCARLVRRMGVLLSSAANIEALAAELHAQVQQELAAAATEAEAAAAAAAAGPGAAAAPAPGRQVELATVRRMVEGIFSVQHVVYVRVQAGIVAAATALLRSAGGGGASGGGSPWKKVLRGVQAEALAPDVRRLAAALHRITAVSAAVAGPDVYWPLLGLLHQEQPQGQRRRH